MNETIIYQLVCSGVLAFSYAYVYKATKKEVKADETGKHLLKMGKIFNVIGYAGMVFALVILIGPILSGETIDALMAGMMVFLFAVMGFLGLICVLLYRNHYVLFDDQYIEVRNVWGKTKHLSWNNISAGTVNPFTGMIALRDGEGNEVKIYQYLTGLSGLMARVK